MKPVSRTAVIATAMATVLLKIGVSPWYTFMISSVLFVGVVRLTGIFPGHFPSITSMIGVAITIELLQLGVSPLYSFIAGGIIAFPIIMLVAYKYLGSEQQLPNE